MAPYFAYGAPYETVRCHFTKTSEPEWFPSDGRRCRNYYELGEKTNKRDRHAVSTVHTNHDLMYPSALNTNNDDNNEGQVDTTTQDTPHVTIRDRNTPLTTPAGSRGDAPQSPVSPSVLSESPASPNGLSEAVENIPTSKANTLASIQSALKIPPELTQQMKHLTLKVEKGEERVPKQFTIHELLQAESDTDSDDGSIGLQEYTLESRQEVDGVHYDSPVPPGREPDGNWTQGRSGPSPQVELATDVTGVPSEATRASSSGQLEYDPGDDESSDDDKKSVMLQEFPMASLMALCRRTPCRKFLIPATAPKGGKDSTKTDHSLDDLHLRFPERSTVSKR